jgi:hypothetical protein
MQSITTTRTNLLTPYGAVEVVCYYLYLQSVPITIKVVSDYCESLSWRGVQNTPLCDKFVSDLRQVGGFLRFLPHK